MAVITKIREKYATLAGGVIAVSLVGFLLMDAGDNIKKIFSGGNYIAKVNGDKIDPKDYSLRIQEYETLYELMGNKIDDNIRAQIHDQVLREMIFERASQDDIEKLGLMVTKEEEKEMITGTNPDPMITQFPYFKNPETGQFDPQAVAAFENNKLPKTPEAQKALEQWQVMKNYIKRNRLMQKYNNLFGAAAYTPKFVMDRQMKDQAFTASMRYVKVPFTTVNDAEVKVTDNDINDYIKKHEAQYKIQDPTRSIEYVSFEVLPSKDDTARSLTALQNLKGEFTTTTDNESFVKRNSEETYTGAYVSKKSFASRMADSILAQPVGTVVGPYFENGAYKLTKVESKMTLPDSTKVRHILVKTEERGQEIAADSVAKRKLDSAIAMINTGGDFKAAVTKFSEDEGSKNTGGEYDFTLAQRSGISKEFGDFAFEGKPGEKKTVKVDNDAYAGYHYIEIISQKDVQNAAKLATISKSLFADEQTESLAYSRASEFAGKNSNGKAFDEAVKKDNLNKLVAQNIKVNDFVIPGVGSSREIIRWVYGAKVGDVSPVFNLDGKYVVAKLSADQKEGLMKVDEGNRPMLEAAVKAEKKAELIMQKYKNAKTLDAVASASGQAIQQADSFNAAGGFLPNVGYEPKVVGYAFSNKFQPNTMSPGIKGQDGVYFISVVSKQQGPMPTVEPAQMAQQRRMMSMQLRQNISNQQQEVIRRKADVKYSAENLY